MEKKRDFAEYKLIVRIKLPKEENNMLLKDNRY